ncbi:DUF664 domain-containing protein [Granulicoccus phenolivorans]|uniref:mycothiol transferase n=1 Tax=Granulicoccus phenolivorans TaxID=266854 RepID=UPI0004255AB4|nr:DUF664 domain-containing protein [Granulicoccus phenolivorans]
MSFNPHHFETEQQGYATFLAHQQDGVRALVHGLDDRQIHAAPSASALSLAWVLKHLTVVQQNWLDGVLAAPEPLTEAQNTAIRARNGNPTGQETAAELLAGFDEVCAGVVDAARTKDPAIPLPIPAAPWFQQGDDHWSVRWVWLHLLQEIARHAGHGDIIRETLDGGTAFELVAAHQGHTETVFGMLQPWTPKPAPFTRGISTVVLAADDLPAAESWYADLFGIEAYYHNPAYVEFRIGPHDHEFGILNRAYAGRNWAGEPTAEQPGGVVVHLWVPDADAALAHLIAKGATPQQPARDFSEPGVGYRGGSVVDPFGNVVGVMERPY